METRNPTQPADPELLKRLVKKTKFGEMVERAHELVELAELLQNIFPRELTGLYQIINLNKNVLILAVPDAAIATKMKYSEYDLLAAMDGQPSLRGIDQIDIKVRPKLFELKHSKNPTPRQGLSPQARQYIDQAAETINDPELAEALKSLASNGVK
nr:DciA family protein [Gammaproteobacteria bacterium]